MSDLSIQARLRITAALLLGAFLLLHSVSHGEPIVPHRPLHELPYVFSGWTGKELPFEDRIVQAVGVTDYTNRIYFQRPTAPVELYIGYYASQQTGDTIHSPKNCLPGAGWDPIKSGYATISLPAGNSFVVNQYVIAKDQQKALVFYWYQGRGRIIASEYSGKFWMTMDAISRHRTDGALLRVITSMDDGESNARARLLDFTQQLFPQVDALIPK